MKLSVKINLNPSSEQHILLLETMKLFNKACNTISQTAFHNQTFGKWPIQKLIYHDLRKTTGIPAQLLIRAIAVVCGSYKAEKKRMHWFKETSSIPYDTRLRTFHKSESVSLRLWNQRITVPIILGQYQAHKLNGIKLSDTGESDLIYDRIQNRFYLVITFDQPETPTIQTSKVLGLDLGIKFLVADSDGALYTGAQVEQTRNRYAELRKRLQARHSKSSFRHLKKLSGKEHRYCKDVDHCLSKQIVQKAKGTGRSLALEELKGIRERLGRRPERKRVPVLGNSAPLSVEKPRKHVRKSVRTLINKWSFSQLRLFIAYKAKIAGVRVYVVPAYYSSQTCNVCGHVSKSNRISRDNFRCKNCGHAEHADINAAKVISQRASVNRPTASGVGHTYKREPYRARCKPTDLSVGS
jgi:predicted transposase